MNLKDFELKLTKDHIKWQRKNLKRSFLIGMIYPVMILWCSVNLYFTPTHWLHSFALGVNVTSLLFYLITMIDAVQDYKHDIRMLEFYEIKYKDGYESDNRIE